MIDAVEQPWTTGRAPMILIVEDNDAFASTLRMSLETEGYAVECVGDGEAAIVWLAEHRPDLIILDLMLPKANGFEVLRRYRGSGGAAAVLILSAREQEVDKVQGFRIGADDYVVKTTGLLELLARIEAMLRRVRGTDLARTLVPTAPRYTFSDVVVDVRTRRVTRNGDTVDLTPMEFDLLVYLIQRQGAIVSREQLLHNVWRYTPGLTSRTVDQHVSRLRIKLESEPAMPLHFLTVRKAGYRFEP